MTDRYDAAVVIGRFQPAHNAHLKIFEMAADIADKLIVLIGSANEPATPKNPFSFDERKDMISRSLSKETLAKVTFVPIEDTLYNINEWISNVQNSVNRVIDSGSGWSDYPKRNIVLVGHEKDESSYYLKMFPQWKRYEVDNISDLNSTDIRTVLFEDPVDIFGLDLSEGIKSFLDDFTETEEYKTLQQEYEFIKKYKAAWDNAPYAPTFLTTDAVVVASGHILLIERRAAPGKGLLALPGGFVDQNETLEDGVLRELREETKIKVPEPVLRGNIKKREMFDSPYRSQRGRTVTQAFLIELSAGELPKVKGGDDAAKAKWVPINEVLKMKDKMYEDHHSIILKMIGV